MQNSKVIAISGGIAVAVIISIILVSAELADESVILLPLEPVVELPDEGTPGKVILDEAIPDEDKLLVYTTFYPLHQFTQNIARDAATVKTLISSGGDPHAFELGPRTIAELSDADMLIYNGADFEPYIDEIKSVPDFAHIVFVDSSEGITLLEGERHDHHDEEHEEEHEKHDEEHEEEHEKHDEEHEEEHEKHDEEHEEEHEKHDEEHEEEHEKHDEEHEEEHEKHDEEHEEEHEKHDEEHEEEHEKHDEEHEEEHEKHDEEHEEEHEKHDEEHEEEHEEKRELGHVYDPHIWLDPILAKKQVMNIATHMATADPENSETYLANANRYSDQLDTLDQEIRTQLSFCKKDTFVPFHNAFSYFAERYDLHTLAVIQEFSPETPVTAKSIEELFHFAEEHDIKYFFTEENRNPKLAERLASELGGDILLFSPLESLSSQDSPDTTYFDKMRANMDNLKIALECS